MEGHEELMAERRLKWNDGNGERDIVVRLWKPVLDDENFFCDFAVDGLPTPQHGRGGGVDSLQALTVALSGIRAALSSYRDAVSFLDVVSFHGVPMTIPEWLPDIQEQRRLEQLVESEALRIIEELATKKRTVPYQARAAAVLYAKDLNRLRDFYADLLGLRIDHADEEYAVLESRMFQLVILAIPTKIAASIEIANLPRRREDTPIKLVFFVPSISAARSAAVRLGGELNPVAREWEFQGHRVCDGRDPEGNVFQLRENPEQ